MKQYQFTRSIVVDGTPYQAGDRVTVEQIPAGSFTSLTRLGQLVEVPDAIDAAEVFAATMEAGSPLIEPASVEVGSPANVEVLTTPSGPPAPVPDPAAALVGPPGEPPPAPKHESKGHKPKK